MQKKRMNQRAEFECINMFQSKGKFCPHYSSFGKTLKREASRGADASLTANNHTGMGLKHVAAKGDSALKTESVEGKRAQGRRSKDHAEKANESES